MTTTFALAGAGRVGTAVAILLTRAGWRCAGVASRSPSSAQDSAGRLGAPVHGFDSLPEADVVLVGASDGAIDEVARAVPVKGGSVVWHLAGSLGLSVLDGATARGAVPAALHPVQTIPDVDSGVERLPGSAWGVTADERAATWALATVELLGGTPVVVAEGLRPRWHAASVVTANGISALLAAAEELARSAGAADPMAVLGPLAAGAVDNARASSGAATLTGPLVRGEVATIRRHLDALSGEPALAAYLQASRLILGVATSSERIDPETAAEMTALLEGAS